MPIQVTCPACGQRSKAPDEALGKKAKCPRCKKEMVISPDAPAQTEEPPAREAAGPSVEKSKRAVALVEKYIGMDHPVGEMERMFGMGGSKPKYRPVPGGIARTSDPAADMKIVSVASCLRGGTVSLNDLQGLAAKAMEAIRHYASLGKVRTFFLLPYYLRKKVIVEGEEVPQEEQCRIFAGVENLLLEIYDELPEGGTISDERVEAKIASLLASVQ